MIWYHGGLQNIRLKRNKSRSQSSSTMSRQFWPSAIQLSMYGVDEAIRRKSGYPPNNLHTISGQNCFLINLLLFEGREAVDVRLNIAICSHLKCVTYWRFLNPPEEGGKRRQLMKVSSNRVTDCGSGQAHMTGDQRWFFAIAKRPLKRKFLSPSSLHRVFRRWLSALIT